MCVLINKRKVFFKADPFGGDQEFSDLLSLFMRFFFVIITFCALSSHPRQTASRDCDGGGEK